MKLQTFTVLSIFSLCGFADAKGKDIKVEAAQRYVLSKAKDSSRGLTQFDCSSCSAMKDFLFIAASCDCNDSGCLMYVFKPNKNSYQVQTHMFLRAHGFQFLSTKTNGWNDILLYQPLTSAKGFVVKDKYNGKIYVGTGKNKIIQNADASKYLTPETIKIIYFTKDLLTRDAQ
jgi:hypothetical protein